MNDLNRLLRHHVTGAIERGEAEAIVEVTSCCPACGEPIDYCQGHGELGDPDGYWIIEQHDKGEHQYCDKRGCDDARHGRLFTR
jgi:hypothetical protein